MIQRKRHDSVTDLRAATCAQLDRATATLERVGVMAIAHREAAIAVQREDDPVDLLSRSKDARARARIYAAEAELAQDGSAEKFAAHSGSIVESMAATALEKLADRLFIRAAKKGCAA